MRITINPMRQSIRLPSNVQGVAGGRQPPAT